MKRQPKSFENVETGTDQFHGDPTVVIDCHIKELFYGTFRAVRDTAVPVVKNAITALIGPSGCGKSTVLRCFNRMNDLVRGFRFTGHVRYRGWDIYGPTIDAVAVRRYIGMVFQQPNPFATSIYNNVAFGLRLNRYKGDHHARVEHALKRAALWDEVKDQLKRVVCRFRVDNNNGYVSPGQSPPNLKFYSWMSPARRWIQSQRAASKIS